MLFGAQLLFLLPVGLVISTNASSYMDFLPILLMFFLIGGGLKEPMENMMNMVIHSGKIAEGVARIDGILNQPEFENTGNGDPLHMILSLSMFLFPIIRMYKQLRI